MGSDLRATSHATRATHFNPRSPDGERLPRRNRGSSIVYISIHAPRMGSDCRRSPVAVCFTYFNPRSPDGERLRILLYSWVSDEISIHAPRMGSDLPSMVGEPCPVRFQSTLPGWGATVQSNPSRDSPSYFNPRSPDGERQGVGGDLNRRYSFQSTLPGWGATTQVLQYGAHPRFQSTLPGWGATLGACLRQLAGFGFQSTLPGWGATSVIGSRQSSSVFQSTLPGWGATVSA